jgi:hypothetical protein
MRAADTYTWKLERGSSRAFLNTNLNIPTTTVYRSGQFIYLHVNTKSFIHVSIIYETSRLAIDKDAIFSLHVSK